MQTFTLEATAQKTSKLALALVATLALVVSLLAPVSPAHASGTPSITGVSPTVGVAGTTVTITGNVAGVTRVDFGSVGVTTAPALVVAGNGQSLTVVAPAQTTGSSPYAIKLTTPTGTITLNGAFTYRSTMAPSVSSVSPASGLATGFNTIVITGSNFTGASAVRFGTTNPVSAVAFSVLSDSRISAVVPEGVAGTSVRVSVVTPNGTSASLVNYSYKTTTCVPGRYLTTTFNYRSSTLTTAQKRKIREVADELVLLGCESVELLRYTGVRAGSPAAYKSYLTLSNRRANNMLDVFTKRLTNRGVTMQITEVKRANQKSQRRVANWDSFAPYRKLNIRVAVSEGIDVVYPSAGPTTGGGTVTITGRGFTNLAATGAVRFGLNASPSYTVNATGTKITATVPAGLASNSSVSIQRGVPGTSTAKVFTRGYSYVAAPTITSLNLTAGSIVGGTTVTITGTNFTGVTGVSFGSNRALSYTVNSSTSITAVVPSGAAGGAQVLVAASGGNATSTFTYKTAPSISSITPAEGPFEGGVAVAIAGSGFDSVVTSSLSSVRFEGVNSTAISVSSDTSMSATPAAILRANVGLKDVLVVNPYGEATAVDGYKQGVTVTFEYNGATSGNSAARLTSTAVTGSGSIILPVPLRTNWSFAGWYESNIFANSAIAGSTTPGPTAYTVESSRTIYAKWTATVTYDVSGGTAITAAVFTLGSASYTLPVAVKASETFEGWYTDEARTTAVVLVDGKYTPTGNVTLYAKFSGS